VFKTLCYKPEGRGFETRWGEWIFLTYLILPAAQDPGVHSASNRNEYQTTKNKTNLWPEYASELYLKSDSRLSAKLVPTLADRGFHVVRVPDPYGSILGFLDRSRYFFFKVASQVYSRVWVDPVPDPLLRKSHSARNRTRTSGSIARNSEMSITSIKIMFLGIKVQPVLMADNLAICEPIV
jgi:hypothetical protein